MAQLRWARNVPDAELIAQDLLRVSLQAGKPVGAPAHPLMLQALLLVEPAEIDGEPSDLDTIHLAP
jgi:hypothetical protein